MILRGGKTAELRSVSTRIVGVRFYIYACKAKAAPLCRSPPEWMAELAEQVKLIEPELLRGALLPTGVVVGRRSLAG